MEYNSDEDILNAHPTIQIIEQDDVPEATSSLTRSQFRVVVKEGALARGQLLPLFDIPSEIPRDQAVR
jgi:hypothetical protein